MNILGKLFGKWELESKKIVEVGYESVLFNKQWKCSQLLTVELHSRTKEKRAFLVDISGDKTKVDINFLQEKV